MTNRKVNVVIVGAGAGGGVVAKELSLAGLSVVLFERGGWVSYDDHAGDELLSQRTTVLGNSCGPDDVRYRRVLITADGNRRIVLPSESDYHNIAACVGSGTVTYGALAWRFMPEDFRMKTVYGEIPGTTLEDWPISYDDLEPFYEKAEWELGVSGDDSQNPYAPPRKRNYPMPAFIHNREASMLNDAALRLGWHPFSIPMLRNSVPYGGRPACIRMRNCIGFPCPVNAKAGTQNTVIPMALASGNCELRTHCNVSELIVDEYGRITGVLYFDETNRKQKQLADIVVLSASATETPRLLLNSKSRFFSAGIGNENDWVGRNLHGHPYPRAFGLFDHDIYDDFGPGCSVAVCDFNHHNQGIVGGGYLSNSFIRMPYAFTTVRPPGALLWGKEHKEFQRNYYKRMVEIHGPYQEIPNFEQRVEVDENVKDFWGIPAVRLSGKVHEKNLEGCKFMAAKAEEWLREAGAISVWSSPGMANGVGALQHQAGTCRMGNDPKTSVTDKFGRIHSVPNVFVADASLHVTNGGFNPVLTILALGYWVSKYIVNEWNHGNKFKS